MSKVAKAKVKMSKVKVAKAKMSKVAKMLMLLMKRSSNKSWRI